MINWPPIRLVRVDEQPHPRHSGMREVQPWFSRAMPKEWAILYEQAVEAGEAGEWMGAGFVLCLPAEVGNVKAHLERAANAANERYMGYLARVRRTQPKDVDDWLQIENIAAASYTDGDAYGWHF